MDITPKNVRFFAEIRKIIPRCAIGVDGILTCYSTAEKLLSKTSHKVKRSRSFEFTFYLWDKTTPIYCDEMVSTLRRIQAR
jgi:hypothetical protein